MVILRIAQDLLFAHGGGTSYAHDEAPDKSGASSYSNI